MSYQSTKYRLASLAFACFISSITSGQKPGAAVKPPLIGMHFTLTDFNSPTLIKNTSFQEVLAKGDLFNPGKHSPGVTISYSKGINQFMDLSGKFNSIFHNKQFSGNPSTAVSGNTFAAEAEGGIHIHAISDAHFFTPFINTGIGAGFYGKKPGAFIPLGLGWQLNFKRKFYLFLQNQFRISLSTGVFPDNLFHSLGVAFNVSGRKQAKPIYVTPVKRPPDRDYDGIIDSLDSCPDQFGYASLQGCPDKDGDGIEDRKDSCVDIAGIIEYHGCPVPDKDNDGINDEEDKCPDEPGAVRYQGCPVPDSDKDGINNEEDKCPDEAGTANNFGCPEIKQELADKMSLAAKNIFFATGTAKLLDKSFASLNNVVKILNENPLHTVVIEGHTDSTGNPLKNQILSEDRASSVSAYLVEKGVEAGRITSKGYGAQRPVANNKTADGRAKNRRVELKLQPY